MKQPTHNFNLEARKTKSGKQLILFNLSYGIKKNTPNSNTPRYQPFRISTEWSINKEYWIDKPTYRANQTYVKKYGKDLNNVLDKIERISYEQLSFFRNTFDKDPTNEELKQLVFEKLNRRKKDNQNTNIADYTEKLISRRTNLTNTSSEYWGDTTAKQYQAIVNRIKRYESDKNIKLTFGEITEEIYWDYFKTINDYQKTDNGEYYTQTTVNKEFRSLRAIFNCAKEDGIDIQIAYSKKNLKIPSSPASYETYLSEEQLNTIINTDTSHSKEFEHARNYIILSSFTGLRIGDMIYLHEVNPETIIHKSKKYNCFTTKIRKSPENTQELIVTIPILKPVKNLLEANGNKFPKFTSEPNIRKVIKKFLKHLEFKDKIKTKTKYYLVNEIKIENKEQHTLFTPHDCRRTFITNIKQLGVQNDTIEPITHPKIKNASVLDGYDKSTLDDKAVKFLNQLSSKKSPLFKY
ncbi:phage integrase SAM-like domain-containing protein [Flavobacterium sp. XS2P24]|uniref:tyrosine-type recombinase/integrase n=1 Tax=Flavobacterium sp. XS2P24 TaxID=3041249 RepID=UPI0024A9939E|nr:phage integrase SAM-like domain-containing protein [Flavobacterium sp. XS2P24]MDI6049808.1 phage integrase SAM-like domain-containing protein [Flavobacterium sp. XS2P24]